MQLFKVGLVGWKRPLAKATAFVVEHLVQLPRAHRLVRSLCRSHDSTVLLEAITLLRKLYIGACDEFMRQIIENLCPVVPTRSTQIATLVPQSYHFESTYAYKLLIRYHTFEVLLYGLLEEMHRIYPLDIDMAVMRHRDVQAANSTAMCIDHALNMYPSMGLLTVRLILPLQFSYYSWQQLEKRSILTPNASSDYQRARAMKSLVLEIENIIGPAWRAGGMSSEYAEGLETSLFGGDFTERLERSTDTALIVASLAGDSGSVQDLAESRDF